MANTKFCLHKIVFVIVIILIGWLIVVHDSLFLNMIARVPHSDWTNGLPSLNMCEQFFCQMNWFKFNHDHCSVGVVPNDNIWLFISSIYVCWKDIG
jgi:hypothetical protein